MLYFILFILLICICLLLYIKSNNQNTKTKEHFKSRITMDDVLDKYCVNKLPSSMDNYEGPWLSDTYVGPARCGRYECPTEVCSTIQPEFGYFGNPHAFFYSETTDKMAWESNLDSNIAGNCVTKHNPDSNIFCQPHGDPPQCPKHMFDQRGYRFNSNVNQWETRFVNYLMNSNGDCRFRDVNNPFNIVQLHDTNFNYIEGDNTSPNIYYKEIGSTCTLQFDSAEKWYHGDGNQISMNDYERYNDRTKEFVCKNGARRQYGYVDSPGIPPGFSCGLSGSNCGTCEDRKGTPCYIFDSNDRSFSKMNFLQTYFNHDGNDATNEVCNTYVVRPDMNDQFEQLNRGRYYLDESHLYSLKDDLLIHDPEIVITKDQFNITHSNICKTDVVPDQCSAAETTCRLIGSELEQSVLNNFISPGSFTPDTNLYPIENKLINVDYRRRWNSNGTDCEYCIVHSRDGSIIEDSCKSDLSCDNTVTCPKGTTIQSYRLSTYCTFCGSDEYYDETTSSCQKLDGCDEGLKFNPFDNVDGSFRIYNQETKTNMTDNGIGVANRVTPTNYKHYDHTFLDNNTPSQCSVCGPNTYMNDYAHVNLECNTCDPIDSQYGIFQTVVNNRCALCGEAKPNFDDNSPNPKYITYSNNIRYCNTCPALDDPQYKGQKVIALTSDVDGVDGQCYRECLQNQYGHDNIRINDNLNKRPYDSNNGKYDKCDIECPYHYKIDAATNTCVVCPVGKEGNYEGDCVDCVDGEYNDVPGSACKPCPNTNDSRHKLSNPKSSSTGSSNVLQCKSACSAPFSSCNVSFTGSTTTGGYNFGACPSTSCSTNFYDRERIVDSQGGFSITEVMGTRNDSVGGFCDPGSTPYDIGQTDECGTGETTTEGFTTIEPFVIEPFGTTYCCPTDMEFDVVSKICECKSTQYFRDKLSESKRTHIGTTVTYASGECKLECSGDATTGTSGFCEMTCDNDKYVNGSTCTQCPLSLNAASMTTEHVYDGDPTLLDCKIKTCSNNYRLVRDECVENKTEHVYYEQINTPWTTNFHGNTYTGISPTSSIRIQDGVTQPSYHVKQTHSLTFSQIGTITDSVLSVCKPTSTDLDKFEFNHNSVLQLGDTVLCCPDANSNLSSVLVQNRNRALCCPGDFSASSVLNNVGEAVVGCCSPTTQLYVSSDGTTGCCPRSDTMDGGKTYSLSNDGTCIYTCIGEYQKNGDGTCEVYNDDCPSTVYMQRKDSDGSNIIDDSGRYIYEQSNVPPTTGACATGDIVESDLYGNPRCTFNLNAFYCCANTDAVYDDLLMNCKTSCSECIYEDQAAMDRRLSSSGGGSTNSSTTVNVIIGATTPSPSVPNQVIYYKTCFNERDQYYDSSSKSYPVCENDSMPTCPTGYVPTYDYNSNIICDESTEKECHKFVDDDQDQFGVHYQMSNFYTTGSSCPSGWQSNRYTCPPNYLPQYNQAYDGYVYLNNDDKYYVCCAESSVGSNIAFDHTSKTCELTACPSGTEPTGDADGSCQCLLTYDRGTSLARNVTRFVLEVPSNTNSCSSMYENLPGSNSDHEYLCREHNGSNYCCPNGYSSRPHGTDESNFT